MVSETWECERYILALSRIVEMGELKDEMKGNSDSLAHRQCPILILEGVGCPDKEFDSDIQKA